MRNNQFTIEGFKKLENELKELSTVKKPQAIERLQKARSMGDLSENSEYTAAKENLELIENRIKELEEILQNAKIVDAPKDDNIVQLGETVIVVKDGQKQTLTIVGEFEANPLEGKISASSPIGEGLLGKRVGEEVSIKTPSGVFLYKIIEIKKS